MAGAVFLMLSSSQPNLIQKIVKQFYVVFVWLWCEIGVASMKQNEATALIFCPNTLRNFKL